MEISKSNVFELLNITGARPSKDFGQNFLIEPNICNKIADVLVTNESDDVLEIGPGLGSLTHFRCNSIIVHSFKKNLRIAYA